MLLQSRLARVDNFFTAVLALCQVIHRGQEQNLNLKGNA